MEYTDYTFENGRDSIVGRAEELFSGDSLVLESNTLIANKLLTFTAKLESGTSITVGHGKTEYSAQYIKLDSEYLRVYRNLAETEVVSETRHGLNIEGRINVVIETGYGNGRVTVQTPNGTHRIENISWHGRQGAIYADVENGAARDAVLRFTCKDYNKPIYAFGDSYFNCEAPTRWPSYLIKDGHRNFCLFGFPGMGAQHAIVDLKTALKHGKPKYVFWCMGMNNPDHDGRPNDTWLSATKEMLSICESAGIIPILSTIPDVPDRVNAHKNEFTKSVGARIVDFQKAVQIESTSYWYDGMLYSDNVHPDKLGAMALYMQAITDFPELMM